MKKYIASVTLISAILAWPFFLSCNRWRVTQLQPEKSIIVPFGKGEHQVQVFRNIKGIFNTPENIALTKDKMYIADTYGAKILVINRENGIVTKTLGNKNAIENREQSISKQNTQTENVQPLNLKEFKMPVNTETKDKKEEVERILSRKAESHQIINIPLVYPEKIGALNNGELIVHNRNPMQKPPQKKFQDKDIPYIPPMAPSHLLVINPEGKVTHKLYQDPANNTPYKQIMGIYTKADTSFVVISRESPDRWLIQKFSSENKKEMFRASITPEFIQKADQIKESGPYHIIIEEILPRSHNNEFFISVSYYKNARFKFRRILSLKTDSPQNLLLFTEFLEPLNELFWTDPNGKTYFWTTTDQDKVTIKIFDNTGDLVDKRGLILFGKQEAWREFIPRNNGKLLTVYISRVAMEIIFWK